MAQDAEKLAFGIMCVAAGKGEEIGEEELATALHFFKTIPDLMGQDVGSMMERARQTVERYPDIEAAMKELAEIEEGPTRNRCYILAAEYALASGDIDAKERHVLDALGKALRLDPAWTRQVEEIFSVKYSR